MYSYEELSLVFGVLSMPLSLLQWSLAERQAAKADAERDSNDRVQRYLEWLRRENHNELVSLLESNTTALADVRRLIGKLQLQNHDGLDKILSTLQADFHAESVRHDELVGKLDRLLVLFPEHAPLDERQQTFERAYLDAVRVNYDRLRMLGLRQELPQKTSIAYVALNARTKEQIPSPAAKVLESYNFATIRGPAGSGKTTLLHWMALRAADPAPEPNAWKGGIPFLIPLRNLPAENRGQPTLQQLPRYTLPPSVFARESPIDWVERVLLAKRGIILIDGLDELPPTLRPRFWEWLDNFQRNYPGNRIYLSSRHFTGTDSEGRELWSPPKGMETLELEELDDSAVAELIRNWHDALELAGWHNDDIERLNKERNRLPQVLKEPVNKHIRSLCRNPLLCAMVCAINWIEEGDLPSRRIDIYKQCCDLLVETRDKRREIKAEESSAGLLSKAEKLQLLQRLAWDMSLNRSAAADGQHIEVDSSLAQQWLAMHIKGLERPEVQKCESADVLRHFIERTNLLREPSKGRIDFPHRSFQEYLAACAAGAMLQHGFLVAHATDDQWHEVIMLSAGTHLGGMSFAELLINGLLDRSLKLPAGPVRASVVALALGAYATLQQPLTEARSRLIAQLGAVAPPATLAVADELAVAGDAALPHLAYQKVYKRGAKVVAASARALARIGSAKAVELLLDTKGYGSESRATVVREICACETIHPLEVQAVRSPRTETAKQLLLLALVGLNDSASEHVLSLTAKMLRLDVSFYNLPHLRFLRHFPNLRHFNVSGSTIAEGWTEVPLPDSLHHLSAAHTDLSFASISHLQALKSLSMPHSLPGPLTESCSFPSLSRLVISAAKLTAFPGKGSFPALRSLIAGTSHLNSIETITEACPTLTELDVNLTAISDFRPLEDMSSLQKLNVNHTAFEDCRLISKCANMKELLLSGTPAKTLDGLESLKKLEAVFVASSLVSDLSAISGCDAMEILSVSGSPIEDFSPLLRLEHLKRIYVDNTQAEMPSFAELRGVNPRLSVHLMHDIPSFHDKQTSPPRSSG